MNALMVLRASLMLVVLLNSRMSFGFSCDFLTVKELDSLKDVAIIGEVKKKLPDFSIFKNKYSINVLASYKGTVTGEVVIWTPILSSCGVDFGVGEKYVIFASENKNKLTTSLSAAWRIDKGHEHLTKEFIDFYQDK